MSSCKVTALAHADLFVPLLPPGFFLTRTTHWPFESLTQAKCTRLRSSSTSSNVPAGRLSTTKLLCNTASNIDTYFKPRRLSTLSTSAPFIESNRTMLLLPHTCMYMHFLSASFWSRKFHIDRLFCFVLFLFLFFAWYSWESGEGGGGR